MNNKPSNLTHLSLRLLGCVLLLLSGLVAYWLYRPDIALFQLLHISNPSPLIADSTLDYILKNYFADAVWCLALAQVIILLRDYGISLGYRLTLTALPFLSEFMQLAGVITGVFDGVDMTIYLFIMIPTIFREFKLMNKVKKNISGSIAIAFFTLALLASGRPDPVYETGTFTLSAQEDDIFTKTALIKSLNLSDSPSIVLRVPNPSSKITKEQNKRNSVLYNLVEKEFAKAGFVVRDRQLFAKVLDQDTSDYSKISTVTETDFIVELLRHSLRMKYKTNEYIDEDGNPASALHPISFNSAVAEFKLVSLKKNDIVGSYTFYWTPCTEGCKQRFDINSRSWSVNNSVPTEFFKNAARQLAREINGIN